MNPETILYTIPGIIAGFTVHECAHALTAKLLGDDTAEKAGRITLNPAKHIDVAGFIMLLLAGFGWAKPVQFDRSKLLRPRLYEIIISLAGPISNILFSIILILILRVAAYFSIFNNEAAGSEIIISIFIHAFYINIALFVFNLIPIPPLDGSHIYMTFLSKKNSKLYLIFYRYGMGLLFLIIILERMLDVEILPLMRLISYIGHLIMVATGFS